MAVPGRPSRMAQSRYCGLFSLSASMNTKSKGSARLILQPGRVSSAAPDPDVHLVAHAGGVHVRARHAGVLGEVFARDQPAVVGQPLGHPDGAEAGQRADLQDAPGAGELHQQLEQLAGVGRHFDGRHAGLEGGGHGALERAARADHDVGQEVLDGDPAGVGWCSIMAPVFQLPGPAVGSGRLRGVRSGTAWRGLARGVADGLFQPLHLCR